jgi:hypothetical protein
VIDTLFFITFRKNSDIPREAIVTNYNRVLILPRVRVEDQGEYICRAYNDKVSITGSVTLSIQARLLFFINKMFIIFLSLFSFM